MRQASVGAPESALDWTRVLLAMEGAALSGVAVFAYSRTGGSWWLFAALFLAPDLSMIVYLVGPRLGAVAYNCLHVTFVPLVLVVLGYISGKPLLIQIALIHIAHIGFDRALGFGLKYPTGFRDTHLGRAEFSLPWSGRSLSHPSS
ncbi:hypothetical protein DSM21852_16860 [Methylocystis bryophila]|nr:hypothetical protein DSM21852_16860 [Methylocystis bryophila]